LSGLYPGPEVVFSAKIKSVRLKEPEPDHTTSEPTSDIVIVNPDVGRLEVDVGVGVAVKVSVGVSDIVGVGVGVITDGTITKFIILSVPGLPHL
jgi:hypothetical protein